MVNSKIETQMGKILIQTENLTKSFLTEEVETTAIRNINLRIERGEFVAVMGPSGCGKTTLLRHFNGLLLPDSGCIRVLGKRVENRANYS